MEQPSTAMLLERWRIAPEYARLASSPWPAIMVAEGRRGG